MKHLNNFRNLLSIFLFVVTIFPSSVYACSCGGFVWNFCSYNYPNEHVALVTVTDNSINSALMEVKVLENINKVIEDEYITVLGQDGFNCGQLLSPFVVGDTLILCISEEFSDGPWENIRYLDGCGLSYLRYADNQVTGHIHGTLETQDYSEFVANMEDNCLLGVTIDEPMQNPIKIYPTFTSNDVTVETGSYAMKAISIYSSNGELVQQLEGIQLNQKTLDVTDLSKGVYFVQVHIGGQMFTEKIVKM